MLYESLVVALLGVGYFLGGGVSQLGEVYPGRWLPAGGLGGEGRVPGEEA